jgi:predicted metal-dependent phosphoesterase TrpH
MEEATGVMRCDLHVHSIHSGRTDLPILGSVGNECYSEPEEVYEVARRRGMNLVTLTDHDSIEGALRLCGRPDVFVSEEVTCTLPEGRLLHLGVYDVTERQHEEIARRRRDAESLFAYLGEQRIPSAVNHLFSALTGKREPEDFHLPLRRLPLIETRNGMMSPRTNAFAARAGQDAGLSSVGGSDAHTLASVARAWTSVEGARTREEYLAGLRRGLTIPGGGSGSYARLTADVVRIFASAYREAARHAFDHLGAFAGFAALVAVSPVVALVPLVTAGICAQEVLFAARHHRAFRASLAAARTDGGRSPSFGSVSAASSLS